MSELRHNLKGKRFGKLQVIERTDDPGRVRWLCRCDCGGEHNSLSHNLMSGAVTHCGCTPKNPSAYKHTGQRHSKHVGTKSGRLTAVEYLVLEGGRQAFRCECECGNSKVVAYANFAHQKVRSCGCLLKESYGKGPRVHGMTRSEEYRIWQSLLSRCRNKKHPLYKNYGAKGIIVEDRWQSFKNFFYDMGKRPSPKHVIERTSKDVPFGPTTCFWRIQNKAINYRANTRVIEVENKKLTASEAAREFKLCKQTVNLRLHKGRSIDEALSPQRLSSRGKFEFEGKKYTVKRLAQKVGMSPTLLYRRIRSGLSVEEAVNFRRGKKYLVGNEEMTLSEVSLRFGVSIARLRSRLRSGWTVEQAVVGRTRKIMHQYNDRFVSIDEFCAETDIKKSRVIRQHKLGKTLDEIFKDVQEKRERITQSQFVKEQKERATKNIALNNDSLVALAGSEDPQARLRVLERMIAMEYTTIHQASWKLRIPLERLKEILSGKRNACELQSRRMKTLLKSSLPATRGYRKNFLFSNKPNHSNNI